MDFVFGLTHLIYRTGLETIVFLVLNQKSLLTSLMGTNQLNADFLQLKKARKSQDTQFLRWKKPGHPVFEMAMSGACTFIV